MLAGLLMLAGALAVFVPYLVRDRAFSGGVPAPPALFSATEYALAPGASACMSSVAIEPDSRIAEFAARPSPVPAAGGAEEPAPPKRASSGWRPPVELSLTAPGYAASGVAAGGHGYKSLSVAIDPPKHAVIGQACFINKGSAGVALEGTSEARTVSRSPTVLAGASVVGDVALAFQERPRRSLLDGLDTVFGHASALTDGLVPVALIWVLAILVAFGVPVCVLAALCWALREDDLVQARA